MIKSYEILVSGYVQGIGYRAFVARNAGRLNIKGSVKNLPDGRVRVKASAEEAFMKAFFDLLKEGPSFSSVEHLEITELEDELSYEGFRVEY